MIKGNGNDIKLNVTWVVKVIINLTLNPHKINLTLLIFKPFKLYY